LDGKTKKWDSWGEWGSACSSLEWVWGEQFSVGSSSMIILIADSGNEKWRNGEFDISPSRNGYISYWVSLVVYFSYDVI
jgi:hypothetical protein